jgi:hypothetical protein
VVKVFHEDEPSRFIIGRICKALKQTIDKFDLMMKEEQPKQVDKIFIAGSHRASSS